LAGDLKRDEPEALTNPPIGFVPDSHTQGNLALLDGFAHKGSNNVLNTSHAHAKEGLNANLPEAEVRLSNAQKRPQSPSAPPDLDIMAPLSPVQLTMDSLPLAHKSDAANSQLDVQKPRRKQVASTTVSVPGSSSTLQHSEEMHAAMSDREQHAKEAQPSSLSSTLVHHKPQAGECGP
jgi:hypothetical protein